MGNHAAGLTCFLYQFIPRKQWFITASDDMQIRIFNYNTVRKSKERGRFICALWSCPSSCALFFGGHV